MARAGQSKVIFVPMNLAGMGSSGIDNVTQQMAASNLQDGEQQHQVGYPSSSNQQAGSSNLAANAGMISNMANM